MILIISKFLVVIWFYRFDKFWKYQNRQSLFSSWGKSIARAILPFNQTRFVEGKIASALLLPPETKKTQPKMYIVLHVQIRTGSDSWFLKHLRIRIGSDSTFYDQGWTQTENFTDHSSQVDLPVRGNIGASDIHYAAVDWFSISVKLADIKVIVVNRPHFEARIRPEP